MAESELPVPIGDPIPKGYRDLLVQFCDKNPAGGLPKGELLTFNLGKDAAHLTVYNPAPVAIDGQLHIWARVEEKTDEKNSVVRLFKEEKNGEWTPVEGAPVFKGLQDPFYCGQVDGYHIFGGVQIYEGEGTSHLGYRTVFYRYKNSYNELVDPRGSTVDPFAIGPEKMKGIRLIHIEPGRIGVFTRPQEPPNKFGQRGQIGYFEITSLDGLQKALAEYDQPKNRDTLIQGLFLDKKMSLEKGLGDGEWGGANQLFLLQDGKIGVLGHIAGYSDERYIAEVGRQEAKKNYYPITFIFDPETRSVSHVQIIATAAQFPAVEAKNDHLGNILFSGGLVKSDEEHCWLYVGIGDSKGGRIRIEDPFI
ncbi:MAG: DUF1861 family protein [Candidatus Gottesmanbacteria bacterium]|nr:DUF1861 family protein [Candidatus Gottesmanbacteria bacterium]